jgi:hypothetical protein
VKDHISFSLYQGVQEIADGPRPGDRLRVVRREIQPHNGESYKVIYELARERPEDAPDEIGNWFPAR